MRRARFSRRKSRAWRKRRNGATTSQSAYSTRTRLNPHFEARFQQRIPFYMQSPPAKQKLADENGNSVVDLSEFMDDLKTS